MPRGWIEFTGVVLLGLSMLALALIGGLAPVLKAFPQPLGETAIRLTLIAIIGVILLVISLRMEGRKWKHVVVVPLVIILIPLAVVYVPLWFYFSYLTTYSSFYLR